MTLAAARRWCGVVATDYVPALLEQGRRRAEAEDLSFPDESFEYVASASGVMFAPDQDRAAAEMVRVCRPGGKIGMSNWTPEGFDAVSRAEFAIELRGLLEAENRSGNGCLHIPGEYLEVVIVRR